MTTLAKLMIVLLFGGLIGAHNGTSFYVFYYYKDAHNETISIEYPEEVKFSNDNLKTVFVIYEWTEWRKMMTVLSTHITDEVFKNRLDVARIVVISWKPISLNVPYALARLRLFPGTAEFIEKQVSQFISNGMTTAGHIEIVGHGFGAHIAGKVGRMLKDKGIGPVGLITGLDPAAQGFLKDDIDYPSRLQNSDASKVVGIHTNAGYLGLDKKIDENDIWVNGGTIQKRCLSEKWWTRASCSHNVAWFAYVDQLRGKALFEKNDFSRGRNTHQEISSKRTSVSILVLDVSPNMQENGRIQGLRAATHRFLSKLPLGYFVGIIIFGGHAKVASPIAKLTSESVRQTFISSIPSAKTVINGSSIGAGLQLALKLTESVSTCSCPDINLMTDGKEDTAPFILQVLQIKLSCSRLNVLSFCTTGDTKLDYLARDTTMFYVPVSINRIDSSFQILDNFTHSLLDSSDYQLDPEHRPIKLPTKTTPLHSAPPSAFFFDEDIGKNTIFSISSRFIENIDAVFTDPNGLSFTARYDANVHESEIVFKVGDATPGSWEVKMKSRINRRLSQRHSRSFKEYASIYVMTHARKSEEGPITLDALLSGGEPETGGYLTKIEAGIQKGGHKLLNAKVFAYFERLERTSSWYWPHPTVLRLFDNGAGADKVKDDGVYSRFVTWLEGGMYKVHVVATDDGEKTYVKRDDERKGSGTFERLFNVGSYEQAEHLAGEFPTLVTDLKIVSVDMVEKTCTIMWTVPVAEESHLYNRRPKITEFSIIVTSNFPHAQRLNLKSLDDTYVTLRTKLEPEMAGEPQKVTLSLPDEIWENITTGNIFDEIELYFILISLDDQSRPVDFSNIADTFSYYLTVPKVISGLEPVSVVETESDVVKTPSAASTDSVVVNTDSTEQQTETAASEVNTEANEVDDSDVSPVDLGNSTASGIKTDSGIENASGGKTASGAKTVSAFSFFVALIQIYVFIECKFQSVFTYLC